MFESFFEHNIKSIVLFTTSTRDQNTKINNFKFSSLYIVVRRYSFVLCTILPQLVKKRSQIICFIFMVIKKPAKTINLTNGKINTDAIYPS